LRLRLSRRAQKLLDDLEDASNELMITDDTEARACGLRAQERKALPVRPSAHAPRSTSFAQVRYVVGGSLVTMPNDDAETRLQEGARAARHAQRASACADTLVSSPLPFPRSHGGGWRGG
jgi:hypothetical protein